MNATFSTPCHQCGGKATIKAREKYWCRPCYEADLFPTQDRECPAKQALDPRD